ncbi:MAG: isoleucine--tRNA ligase [Saprospiraceae bacterium]|nr:isoleucine--tRNA ligase [Saprospiraceae bacterium]MBP7679628.1 isoleucine--tRNA ligase [Saprospiraceae bacterium]
MYREFKQLNLPKIDEEILNFWQTHQIFQKSVEQRDPNNAFVFYEGPPSANGMPGIHHVMARAVKDLFCRYQTLNGKRVERKGGWDTHGLPIELSVEKELGITKEDIGTKISVDDYNQKCRETVMRYKDRWDDLTRKMGYWVDLDNPYITFTNEYIESVWYLLKKLYDKNLLYKGYTIQPYSPAAGTGLSSHELNMPGTYREVKDTSAVAQFKIIRNEKSAFVFKNVEIGDAYFLAWTTTPWTLPSNTALTVGGNIEYVLVKTYNPYTKLPVNLILAKDLVGKWFKSEQAEADFTAYQPDDKIIPYQIIDHFRGSEFDHLDYEQLLSYGRPTDGDAFKVLIGDFVTTDDGTGIVHTAPSFGADDMRVAKKYGIGSLTYVDKQGKFTAEVTDFANRYVKDYKDDPNYQDVNVDISIKLKQENKAFNVAKYSHNYPHCWRTDKPILYYPLDSWFIKASSMKERMVALNNTINWKPASTGTGRFGNWLENLQDWNLSRSRYWGIPLPIWRNATGTSEKCIGSIAELQSEINKANVTLNLQQQVPIDLHRPYIDDIVLVDDAGEKMVRELDLIDVWFDSGAMPYAQWHAPFENQEIFRRNYPADFIAEGVDQTRGWFYTLHAIGAMCYDSIAYKNVVSNGLVLDKNGQKMSKRLGNAVDPFSTLATFGADATRWYMISNANPWENLKFDVDGIVESRNKFFGTLFNTYNFFAIYANVDGFKIDEQNVIPVAQRPEIDRWVLSKLQSTQAAYRNAMEDYEPTTAVRLVENFVDDLSNWFVRLSRRRFWKTESSSDKQSAFETLFECLMITGQMMAPVAPFFADWLYGNLTENIRESAIKNNTPLRHISVHLSNLAPLEPAFIDPALEQRMDYAQRICSLVLSLRKKEKIRVRQPLQKIMLPILDESFIAQVDAVKELILAEVNVKNIEYIRDTTGMVTKRIKPNFKTLGSRLGKNMKAASDIIGNLSQEAINTIEKNNHFHLAFADGETFELSAEDFVITSEDIPGWLVANDGDLTVALDINITNALRAEGTAREIVNRIQNIRKAKDFNVTDRIAVMLESHEAILPAVHQFSEYIRNEVLANSLVIEDALLDGEAVELTEDLTVNIQVERVV